MIELKFTELNVYACPAFLICKKKTHNTVTENPFLITFILPKITAYKKERRGGKTFKAVFLKLRNVLYFIQKGKRVK